MPTTYAHYRFGGMGLKNFDKDLKEAVSYNRALFDVGLHGPDIFFYYRVVKRNDINEYGSHLHKVPFREILTDIKPRYDSCNHKNALKAYLLGFCGHFTLDSYCHTFIKEYAGEVPRASHGRQESQFDRFLLEKDGHNPRLRSVSVHIHPSKAMAGIIHTAFPDLEKGVILEGLRWMIPCLDFLQICGLGEYNAVRVLLRSVGFDKFEHMLMDDKEFEFCEKSNKKLLTLFNKGLKAYPDFARATADFLDKGTPLPAYFDNHFDAR